jgi:hypothetical protein
MNNPTFEARFAPTKVKAPLRKPDLNLIKSDLQILSIRRLQKWQYFSQLYEKRLLPFTDHGIKRKIP